MKAIANSRSCPNCGSDHKSKPWCEYENGWHCFSCGASKIYDHGYTIKQKADKIDIPDWPDAKSIMDEFTIDNQIRLLGYGIDSKLVRKYQIMETDDGGLILPNVKDGVLISYQIRWYNPRRIQTFGEKTPAHTDKIGNTAILCEDFISYIRINELYNGVCLFGTKASHEILQYVVDNYINIFIWLDDDSEKEVNSGQLAAKKIKTNLEWMLRNKQRRLGYTILDTRIKNIVNKEPKELVDAEIKAIIEGALYDHTIE